MDDRMMLSIIIPVYNCSEYLKAGFEKLRYLYSTDIAFEIIYVNDGSTDNSLEVLNELAENNLFVKVISQENQGSSGARNTALEVAQGKYIQFLDSDDYIDIEEVLKLLNNAVQDDLDAICYRLDYINEFGEHTLLKNENGVPFNQIYSGNEALICGYNPSSICVFLFNTDFLNTNNLRFVPKITHMDVEFTSRMMLVTKRIKFVDKVLYHYLQRQNSITKPQSIERLMKLLHDEVVVASLIKNTLSNSFSNELKNAIQKNYNSVVWNLLWRFISKPKEVDFEFKIRCLQEMKNDGLYPIKGKLKTNFQNFSRFFFNQIWIYKIFLKLNN